MGELGTWLRETREVRGLSLAEVEAQTRIRRRFVDALEEGDYYLIPGEVYVRGFLRNYALFLGLDPDEVQGRYDEEVMSQGLVPLIPQGSDYSHIDTDLEVSSHVIVRTIRRGLPVLLALAVGAAAFVWYWWYDFTLPELPGWWPPRLSSPLLSPGSERPAPEPTESTGGRPPGAMFSAGTSATATSRPTVVATSAVLPLPIPTSVPATTPTLLSTPVAPESEGEAIRLSVQVFETAWTQVTTDGEIVQEGILEGGEELSWGARQSLSFRCGNAGGVLVTVNGEDLGSLGERGEVVDWTWVAQDGRISVITPSPS